jgi:hypothetical protein
MRTLRVKAKGPVPEHFEMEGGAGQPSRWNTLRALRVLRWASATQASDFHQHLPVE